MCDISNIFCAKCAIRSHEILAYIDDANTNSRPRCTFVWINWNGFYLAPKPDRIKHCSSKSLRNVFGIKVHILFELVISSTSSASRSKPNYSFIMKMFIVFAILVAAALAANVPASDKKDQITVLRQENTVGVEGYSFG